MVTAYAQGPADLTAAIKRQLEIGSESPAPQFQYALSDLNGDGKDDAVILITDNEYCGSGGCNLQVFRGGDNGFEFISSSTICKPPIRLLGKTSNGWKTIIVYTGGVGDVLLSFNGKKYPGNPSLQPKATKAQVESAKVLIENYGN
jgi:hypothetical protein